MTESCGPSSTSAVTADTSSPADPGSARRCNAPTTRGRTRLDGRLRAAPRSDREPGFDADELGLRQIQADTWGPFVFVNPDPDAAPLAEALGDVPAQLAEILDVDTLEFRFRAEFELDANWKISCENFLECYHCAVAHPGFSAAVDVSPDAYRLEARGLVSSQVGPLRQNGNSFLADGEVPRSQFHFLWPNFGLNVFPGHPNLSCGPMLPIGPERTASVPRLLLRTRTSTRPGSTSCWRSTTRSAWRTEASWRACSEAFARES